MSRDKVMITITRTDRGICVDISPNPTTLPTGRVRDTALKIEKALDRWGLINTVRTEKPLLRLTGFEEGR